MESTDLFSGPPKSLPELYNMIHPAPTLDYEPKLPSPKEMNLLLDVLLEKAALATYKSLQGSEKSAAASAANDKCTFEDEAGQKLLNLRVLGSWFAIMHSGFCRAVFPDSARTELTREIKLALADKNRELRLSELGKSLRSVVLMWESAHAAKVSQLSQELDLPNSSTDAQVQEAFRQMIEGVMGAEIQGQAMALVRDGFRCLVSGRSDDVARQILGPTRGERTKTQCCRIVPLSTLHNVLPELHSGSDNLNPSDKLDGLRHLCSILKRFGLETPVHALHSPNTENLDLEHLSNTLTMSVDHHARFNALELWFEATPNRNEYNIRVRPEDEGDWPILSGPLTLTNHAAECRIELPDDVPLPSRSLLTLHAVCARVARMSGTAEYAQFCARKREDAATLQADGSTAFVLTEALNRVAVFVH